MSKPDITIIIVNWKVRALLEKCLRSIQKYSEGLNVEIIVVDNDSQDNTAEMLVMDFMDVVAITLPQNVGFAAACNRGIKQASADLILLLNPDTEVTEFALRDMVGYMRVHPEVSILGPQIINSDDSIQKSIRRFPNLLSQILVLLKLINVTPNNKYLQHYLYTDFNYQKEQVAQQVMGAAMLIRRDTVDKIGLLDERFFVWFEEVDYCLRAKKANLLVKYSPDIKIKHVSGASFGQRHVLRKQWHFNNSLLYYFWKNKPFWQFLIILILIPLNFLLTFFYALFVHKRED